MLNCRDLTRLVSESFHRKLTFSERMNVWIHTSMCGICRKFRRLQNNIQSSAKRAKPVTGEIDQQTARLSESSRSRLQTLVVSADHEQRHTDDDNL